MAKATPAPKSIATAEQPQGVPTCHHVLADGRICQSPALRRQLFCYYHSRQRDRQRNIAASALRRKSQSLPDLDIAVITSLNLPTPDDPIAIQVCIAGTLQAMMTGALSGPLGGRLLYGLHLAKCNYREVDAYKERHGSGDAPHAETMPVAATDPEPIPSLEDNAADSRREEEELDRYAALLEIDEVRVPDPDEAYLEFLTEQDASLHELVENLNADREEKADWIGQLRSPYVADRREARGKILDQVYFQLAEGRAHQLNTRRPPQPAPKEEVTA